MEEETTIVFFEFVKGGLAFVGFISVSVVFYSTSNVRNALRTACNVMLLQYLSICWCFLLLSFLQCTWPLRATVHICTFCFHR